jgi:MFS family permease
VTVSRNLALIGWFNFWAEFRLYAPIAILYFAAVSGSYALAMSVYSVARLAQSAFEVPTGILSDRVGRKFTVVYGAVAAIVSVLFYAIGGGYGALLVGAVFEGLAQAFYSGNNEALLYDTLAEMEQRDSFQDYLGKVSSMWQFALAGSALLGSLLAVVSYQIVMWVSVIPMGFSLVVALRLVEPRTHAKTSTNLYAHLRVAVQQFARSARLRTLSVASILNFAIGESAWFLRSAFIQTLWPVWAIGISQLIANLGAAFSYYFAGRLIRRFGEYRLLVGGFSLNEIVNLFVLAVPTVASPLLMSLTAGYYGVTTVAKQTLIQQEFTDEQRATMGSLNSFAGSLVFAIFSFLLGAVADRIGATNALMIAALLSIVPIVLYWRVLRPRTQG